MSKLNSSLTVPQEYDRSRLTQILTGVDTQVNSLSEGMMVARYNTDTGTPASSAVAAAIGDIVWNSNATMLGTVLSQYVVLGWVCTTAGSPGVWRDIRGLTGQ